MDKLHKVGFVQLRSASDSFARIKLCCLQQDIGEIFKFFNIAVTFMSKAHTNN